MDQLFQIDDRAVDSRLIIHEVRPNNGAGTGILPSSTEFNFTLAPNENMILGSVRLNIGFNYRQGTVKFLNGNAGISNNPLGCLFSSATVYINDVQVSTTDNLFGSEMLFDLITMRREDRLQSSNYIGSYAANAGHKDVNATVAEMFNDSRAAVGQLESVSQFSIDATMLGTFFKELSKTQTMPGNNRIRIVLNRDPKFSTSLFSTIIGTLAQTYDPTLTVAIDNQIKWNVSDISMRYTSYYTEEVSKEPFYYLYPNMLTTVNNWDTGLDFRSTYTVNPTTRLFLIGVFFGESKETSDSAELVSRSLLRNGLDSVRLTYAGIQYNSPQYEQLSIQDSTLGINARRFYEDVKGSFSTDSSFSLRFTEFITTPFIAIRVKNMSGNIDTSVYLNIKRTAAALTAATPARECQVLFCAVNNQTVSIAYDANGQPTTTNTGAVEL